MEQHLVELGAPRTVVRYADDLIVLCETFNDASRAYCACQANIGRMMR